MSGECQTKNVKNYDKEDDEKPIIALDEGKQQAVFFVDMRPSNSCVNIDFN